MTKERGGKFMKKINTKIYTIEEIKEIVSPIFKKYNIYNVYLFGSYARNEANKESDIDFIIKTEGTLTMLQLTRLADELENALEKEIDIVFEESYTEDIKNIKNKFLLKAKEVFYDNILKERVVI